MGIDTFNGYLMSLDHVLAEIKNGQIEKVNNATLLPIYLERTMNLHHWLEKRAIDSHRTNSRLLKKVLRLEERDDISTTLAVNAVSITDTYWLKPVDSELTWEKVRFKENYFSELALKGDLSAFSQKPSRTPELTNIGSYEKCWKLENGKWWLYKRANKQELFSELFIYELGKNMGFDMAHYEACVDCIRSLDFTEGAKVNFEAAYSYVGDDEDYVKNYEVFTSIREEMADRYLEMLLLDSICLNVDRHTFNYGLLRDVESGKVLKMAPLFDHNVALLSNGYLSGQRKLDLLGKLLVELDEKTGAVSKYLTRHTRPILTKEMVNTCIEKVESVVSIQVDREYLWDFLWMGYTQTPFFQK